MVQVIKWDKNFNCVASFIKKINALNRLAETSTQSLELNIREALRVGKAKKNQLTFWAEKLQFNLK